MKHGWQIYFVILLLLSLMINTACLATNSINPFQGTWKNDFGSVKIKNCGNNQCSLDIVTLHGVHSCELDGTLKVLSNETAMFEEKDIELPWLDHGIHDRCRGDSSFA